MTEKFFLRYKEKNQHSCGLYFWTDDFMIGVDNDPTAFYRPNKSSGSIYLNCLMYKELSSMAYICEKLGYEDKKVLERLTVDTYIDMVLEPDNPYDRDAVALFFEGEKIGYVPKAEKRPFVACLKLKRGIYGVITDIDESEYPTKYEFEVWQEA